MRDDYSVIKGRWITADDEAMTSWEWTPVGFRRDGYLRDHVTRGQDVCEVVFPSLMATECATVRPGLLAGLLDRGSRTPGVGS